MGFSMTFMPEAEAANQYLWVSVEDAGGSKFYGGQVLEIVVTDPAINRLDEAYGMPVSYTHLTLPTILRV